MGSIKVKRALPLTENKEMVAKSIEPLNLEYTKKKKRSEESGAEGAEQNSTRRHFQEENEQRD